MHGAR
jgi:putative transposase